MSNLSDLPPEEKERAKRRAATVLQAVVDITKAKLDVMRMALDVTPGTYNVDDIYARWRAMKTDLIAALDADEHRLIRMLCENQKRAAMTLYEEDEFERKLIDRWRINRRKERERERGE